MSNAKQQVTSDFPTSTYTSPGANWVLVYDRYWAKYEAQNAKRVGNQFIDDTKIRKYSKLYFTTTDATGYFDIRADISSGPDQRVGTLTLTKNQFIEVNLSDSVIQRARSLFPSGRCSGVRFSVWGLPK